MTKPLTNSVCSESQFSKSSHFVFKPQFNTLRLLGHRGARGEQLENSRDGFAHLQAIFKRQHALYHVTPNIYGAEFDVQLTADEQLVVFHDDTLSRIYGLQARVDQLTYKELLKLTTATCPILRLDELWSWLQGYQHIELEIKTHARSNVPAIARALAKYLPFANLPITLTSFDIALHGYLHRCADLRGYPRGLLIAPNKADRQHLTQPPLTDKHLKKVADTTINLASRLGCQHVGFYYPLIDAGTVQLCQRHGVTLSAWTVNENEMVKRLSNLGVDYIITDYPTRMSSLP